MLDQSTKENLETNTIMNSYVIANFSKLKRSLFFLPLFLVLAIVVFLYSQNALNVTSYSQIQKPWFYFINSRLSQFPDIIYNLTQFGDALIFLSLLSLLIVYAPKVWEALLSASIVSAIVSAILKKLFAVPRPAAVFDNDSFVIIGKTLTGGNSLPSGHSITVFTTLTVLLFAFMPKKSTNKVLWSLLILITGILLVLTRVGVGAHYPLDVTVGSIVGYSCGLLGIFISQKYKIWNWINYKKCYPIFIVLFLVCGVVLIDKISKENLIIFYVTLISLVVSLYKITTVYVKK